MSIFTSAEDRYIKEMINKNFRIKCNIDRVNDTVTRIYFLDDIDIISTLRSADRFKMREAHDAFNKMILEKKELNFIEIISTVKPETLKHLRYFLETKIKQYEINENIKLSDIFLRNFLGIN